MATNSTRIERHKQQLFEHLQKTLEQSVYELYTLCEYDGNAVETSQAVYLLHAAFQDFSEVRGSLDGPPLPPLAAHIGVPLLCAMRVVPLSHT